MGKKQTAIDIVLILALCSVIALGFGLWKLDRAVRAWEVARTSANVAHLATRRSFEHASHCVLTRADVEWALQQWGEVLQDG